MYRFTHAACTHFKLMLMKHNTLKMDLYANLESILITFVFLRFTIFDVKLECFNISKNRFYHEMAKLNCKKA